MLPSCKTFKGNCIYKNGFIGETEHGLITILGKHNNPTHDSEPAQHLKNNHNNSFNWFVVDNASSKIQVQLISEAIYIGLKLNDQVEHVKSHRN